MSVGPSQDAKLRVRQAVDIVDLVGEYLDLRRQGRNYVGLCPWHDDSRPSLQVNPERQTFKCWVCDLGGDVFSFIMKREGVEFPEALRMLAERAGIPLDAAPRSKAKLEEKRTQFDVMAWVQRLYYEFLLRSPEAEPARQYLQGRGISNDSINRFHLGFAPDRWNWIEQQAAREGISPQALLDVGVLGKSQRGSFYDRFKGRVLFSIRDQRGRPVGLGGRVLPQLADDKSAKYVNSPETPLFSKSKLLYGLDLARDAVTKSRAVVVVEGYTDCLAAHQCGMHNVVAVLGTALGPDHIRILRPLADQIILVLDGDEAGRRRTNEVLELFVEAQVDLRVLTLPEGVDPCDFVLTQGAEAFQQLLDGALDALEHKFQSAGWALGSINTHQEHQALEEILATLAKAPALSDSTTSASKIKEAQIFARLAHQAGLDEGVLRSRVSALRKKSQRGTTSAPEENGPELLAPVAGESRQRELLEVLLLVPELFDEARSVLGSENLTAARYNQVYQVGRRLREAGEVPTVEQLLLACADPQVQSTLVELDEEAHTKYEQKNTAEIEAALHEILDVFRNHQEQQLLRRHRAAVKQGQVPEEEATQLFQKMIQQKRGRQGITEPTDG